MSTIMRIGVFIVAASLTAWPSAIAAQQTEQPARPETAEQRTGLVASDAIIGVSVQDHQRQNVGTIDRLIVNRQTGDVEYVIVGTGGFLGIGRDYVQLSWNDVEFVRHDTTIVAQVDRNRMMQAPVVDRGWMDLTWGGAAGRPAMPPPATPTAPPEGEEAERLEALEPAPDMNLVDVDRIVGAQVLDPQQREIGRVERLMIEPQEGRARYMVLGTGGFLGIGRDHILVPYEDVSVAIHDRHLVVTMQQDVIDRAPRAWIGDPAEEGPAR